jgi:hypothetical protein
MAGRPTESGGPEALRNLLRERILAGVHVGRLNAGDRLASYREVADEVGVDLRAVARAYAMLEQEGLVEVRGRSGVFVAPLQRVGGDVLAETAEWFVDVLRDAWTRRIPAPTLSAFSTNCTASCVVRCLFVEGTVDQVESIGAELRDDFGFDVVPVTADRSGQRGRGDVTPPLPPSAREADFIATTAFHAPDLRDRAAEMGVPLVVIRINPLFAREVQRSLADGELTVVCVDPFFADRVRLVAEGVNPERVHTVLASDPDAVARLDGSRPVLVSEAARRQLGNVPLPRSFPDQPMISPESARELFAMLVRKNLDAAARLPA